MYIYDINRKTDKMKTVKQLGITREQMLKLGTNRELIVTLKSNVSDRFGSTMTVNSDIESRNNDAPFELESQGSRCIGWNLTWEEVQDMHVSSIYQQVHDIRGLMHELKQDERIMNDVQEDSCKSR